MGRSAKKKTNTRYSTTGHHINNLLHVRPITKAALNQNLSDIVSAFYSLDKSLKDDDQNMKNYIIIRLATIVEQMIRQAVERRIKETGSLNGITEQVTINAQVLMKMQDTAKERIIASSFNFQNADSVKDTMKILYGQNVFKCSKTKYMTRKFRELFYMRHDIVHGIVEKGANISKHYERTEKLIQNTLNIMYDHNSFYRYKAHALRALGRYEDAIQCFDEALRLDPNDPYVYIHMGSLLNEYGENNVKEVFSEKRITYLDKEIESDPRNAKPYICKGILFENIEEYEKAIECFDRAIDLEPKNVTAHIHKGLSLKDLRKYEEAASCFDIVIKLSPENYMAYTSKGLSLMDLKKYDEAIVVFDEAIMIDPKNDIAYMYKGHVFAVIYKHKIAISYLNMATKLNPKNWYVYMHKGYLFAELKMYKESMECFDRAIMLDLEKDKTYVYKADALEMFGKQKEAIACLDKAIRIHPNKQRYNMKGTMLKNLEKHGKAEACFKKAEELDKTQTVSSDVGQI